MAKRFTDSKKWSDEWFGSLSNDYRMVWLYLVDNCTIAGLWKKDFRGLNFNCNTSITEAEFLEVFGSRVIDKGSFFFIPKFIRFQYPKGLGSNKPVIVSVKKELNEHGLIPIIKELFGNGFLTIKDKDKDMDKEEDKDEEEIHVPPIENQTDDNLLGRGLPAEVKVVPLVVKPELTFENFWNEYDKKINPKACKKIWEKLPIPDKEKIMLYIPQYKKAQPDKQYRKHPKTFLNQESWNDEIISNEQSTNTRTTALTANIGRPSYGGAKSL